MMAGYFKSAWRDVTSSPGWMGKICLLALVGFVPVFGQVVLFGYLFGWARDIAWGVNGPMPNRIFGNEDGKLYLRGLFAWVLSLICSLLPLAVEVLWMIPAGGMALLGLGSHSFSPFFAFGLGGMVYTVVVLAAAVAASLFWLVGSLRMSIYGRFAPGLQFGRLLAMVRHDGGGALRLVGMYLACAAVAVAALVVLVLVAMMLVAGLMVPIAGFSGLTSGSWASVLFAAGGALFLLVPLVLAAAFVGEVLVVLVYALIIRAAGYWMQQFDVPAWRGQDDPMPFEAETAYSVPVPPAPAAAPAPAPQPVPPVAPASAPVPQPTPAPVPPVAPMVTVPQAPVSAAPVPPAPASPVMLDGAYESVAPAVEPAKPDVVLSEVEAAVIEPEIVSLDPVPPSAEAAADGQDKPQS